MRASKAIVFAISGLLPSATVFAQEAIVRELQLVAQFDLNGDKRLDANERQSAREYLASHPELRPPRRRSRVEPGKPGPVVPPTDFSASPGVPLYDLGTFRTVFLEFEIEGWERELADFHGTDVDIAATMVVDGRSYQDVGVHFRGHNSFLAVPEGSKRALTLSPDFGDSSQRLFGYRGLHLLNAYGDPTFLRGVLFLQICREYIPAPEANFVRVVIEGESWGVYVNQQRFDTDFLRDHFGTTKGTRWKSFNNAPGGGLSYLGEDISAYRESYEIKSKDDPAAWAALVELCRVLHQTPPEQLPEALDPIMDVDSVLRLLALDNTLMNGDGYWEDGSDFNLYLDTEGRFHTVPYDVNEAFRPFGRRGVELDPFAMSEDPNKALLGKLLAAPTLRTQYLEYIRHIAENWLDWNRLGPLVEKHRSLIAAEVARDTRKLYSTEEFTVGVLGEGTGTPSINTLRGFVEGRRVFLLSHPEIRKVP